MRRGGTVTRPLIALSSRRCRIRADPMRKDGAMYYVNPLRRARERIIEREVAKLERRGRPQTPVSLRDIAAQDVDGGRTLARPRDRR